MTKKEFVTIYVATHYVEQSLDIMKPRTARQAVSHYIKEGTKLFELVESQLQNLDER